MFSDAKLTSTVKSQISPIAVEITKSTADIAAMPGVTSLYPNCRGSLIEP